MMNHVERLRQLSRPMEPVSTGIAPSGRLNAGIRAVVFDIYGTLFVSGSGDVGVIADHQQSAYVAALQAGGVDSAVAVRRSASELVAAIHVAHAAAKAEGVAYPEVEIREIWRHLLCAAGAKVVADTPCEVAAIEYEGRVNPVWPMPGMVEVLAAIRDSGRRMGIISNAQFYTPLLFDALLGTSCAACGFEARFCRWSYIERKAKPAQGLFARVLDPLGAAGITPDQIVYIGNDIRNDIGPAQTLGCQTVLFAGDQRSLRWRKEDPRYAGVQPDAVITDLRQLLDLGLGAE